MGGVCIAASRFYKSKRNIILGAGILFVAAGNVIILHVHMFVLVCRSTVSACVSGALEIITCQKSFCALFGSVSIVFKLAWHFNRGFYIHPISWCTLY